MYRSFVKKHVVSLSILLFVSAFLIVQHFAPSFLYKKNGGVKTPPLYKREINEVISLIDYLQP